MIILKKNILLCLLLCCFCLSACKNVKTENTQEELKEMAILIKCRFAAWRGCHLRSLAYAGDGEKTVFVMKYVTDTDREEKEGRWFLRKTTGGDWIIDRYLASE